jgi:DNA-binding NtrC family response regulator
VAGPEEALGWVAGEREPVGVVIQDMNFTPGSTSGREGRELFRRLRGLDPHLPVLLLTAWTSLETAVELVKEGASDYLAKPWDDEKLLATVRNLLRLRKAELENRELRQRAARERSELAAEHDLRGAVFESPAMRSLVTLALQVAPSEVPILITGPSGSGKEMLAEIVQANSRRRDRPFLRVNVGALPDELLESELFGAEAGAFTGAVGRRIGRFEAADGGTLFLDEIGNLSASGQAKLLRVLESGEFQRLGSNRSLRADVRLLCATNSDLREEIAASRFREDLYFRLNGMELALPPLEERPEDLRALAEAFLGELPPSPGGASWSLSPEAWESLLAHPWPGNVRELLHVLRRATLTASDSRLTAEDLGLEGRPKVGTARSAPPVETPRALAAASAESTSPEKARIERALEEAQGVVARAAEILGLSRQALYRRMEKHGLSVERRLRR